MWLIGGAFRDQLIEVDTTTMTEVRRIDLDDDHSVAAATETDVWLMTARAGRRFDIVSGTLDRPMELDVDSADVAVDPDGSVVGLLAGRRPGGARRPWNLVPRTRIVLPPRRRHRHRRLHPVSSTPPPGRAPRGEADPRSVSGWFVRGGGGELADVRRVSRRLTALQVSFPPSTLDDVFGSSSGRQGRTWSFAGAPARRSGATQ
jgi:hypothetical protein